MSTFTIEAFATECKAAMAADDDAHRGALEHFRDVLRDNDPAHIVAVLEAAIPPGADIGEMIVHQSDDLTMLYGRIPPRFESGIHNHTVFACIGQLTGAEKSTFYERADAGLRVTREQTAEVGDVIALPADVIHHIENPGESTASALHIYGGDFSALMSKRSLWSTADHAEYPFDFKQLLVESIAMMRKSGNTTGLQAMAEAIPAVRQLVESDQST